MTLKELQIKIEHEIKINKEITKNDLDIKNILKNIIKISKDVK